MNKEKKCCICDRKYEGIGNNPSPVKRGGDGRCCDICNNEKVIPARLEQFRKK
jgi:hypothetical protein